VYIGPLYGRILLVSNLSPLYIMFKVKYYLVVPNGVRFGTALSSSPKEAYSEAINLAYAASEATGQCESIGVEGYTMWRDGKQIHTFCDL